MQRKQLENDVKTSIFEEIISDLGVSQKADIDATEIVQFIKNEIEFLGKGLILLIFLGLNDLTFLMLKFCEFSNQILRLFKKF